MFKTLTLYPFTPETIRMKMGIHARIVILMLGPATLIALVLALYFTIARLQDQEKSFLDEAHAIANHVAHLYGLVLDNQDLLNALGQSVLDNNAVNTIVIRDNEDHVLLNLSKPAPSEATVPSASPLVIKAPVYRAQLNSNPSSERVGEISLAFSRDDSLQQRREIIKISLLISAICLLLAFILGQRTSLKVSTPLLRLENAIRELRSSRRDILTQQSLPKLGNLEGDIDAMVWALKTSHKQLQEKIGEATAELRETMEELEIKNVELDIARKKAIQASRVKSEFLANMSHEIRTPMNGVMGFIELLSKTKLNRTQQDYLRTLRASAENLMIVLNDILDFSKIEAGKFRIRQRNFELRETLENAVSLFAANAQHKGLKLILDIEPDVPSHVVGDAPRIAQIVTNFVSNAVKFTDQGEVEVIVRKLDDSANDITLNLTIRDTGIGIAPVDQKRLFSAFSQLDTSTTRRHSGTGLGLAICQRLVSLMDGKISVASQVGKGSIFSVTLKLAKQESTNQLTEVVQQTKGLVLLIAADSLVSRAVSHILEYGGIKPHWVVNFAAAVEYLCKIEEKNAAPRGIVIDDSSIETVSAALFEQLREHALDDCCKVILLGVNEDHPKVQYLLQSFATLHFASKPPTSRELLALLDARPRSPQPEELERQGDEQTAAPVALTTLRVLLADDNHINRRLARIFLEQIGTQVDEAANGLEAVEACLRKDYDLLFMDIHMPGMDGLEATRRIRTFVDSANRNIPIIALTADVMNQKRTHYLQAGMNDYLAKPITEAALRQCLEKWCGYHQGTRAVPQQPLDENLA